MSQAIARSSRRSSRRTSPLRKYCMYHMYKPRRPHGRLEIDSSEIKQESIFGVPTSSRAIEFATRHTPSQYQTFILVFTLQQLRPFLTLILQSGALPCVAIFVLELIDQRHIFLLGVGWLHSLVNDFLPRIAFRFLLRLYVSLV